jgi:hypothetical protein
MSMTTTAFPGTEGSDIFGGLLQSVPWLQALTGGDAPAPSPPKQAAAPNLITFYAYRAQSSQDYPDANVNFGDLGGVLLYLKSVMVRGQPTKNNITRIRRVKITLQKFQLGRYVEFEDGTCSEQQCDDIWHQYGHVVGCQAITQLCQGRKVMWYSLPGAGACPGVVTGGPDCSYHVEQAGEITLDYLASLTTLELGYEKFFEDPSDGRAATDEEVCSRRIDRVKQAFAEKFPDYPVELDAPPQCN